MYTLYTEHGACWRGCTAHTVLSDMGRFYPIKGRRTHNTREIGALKTSPDLMHQPVILIRIWYVQQSSSAHHLFEGDHPSYTSWPINKRQVWLESTTHDQENSRYELKTSQTKLPYIPDYKPLLFSQALSTASYNTVQLIYIFLCCLVTLDQ